jgi:hypothetical protein
MQWECIWYNGGTMSGLQVVGLTHRVHHADQPVKQHLHRGAWNAKRGTSAVQHKNKLGMFHKHDRTMMAQEPHRECLQGR